MVTFELCKAKRIQNDWDSRVTEVRQAFEGGLVTGKKLKVEAVGGQTLRYGGACHGFFDAVHRSFDRHIPLTLTPDSVWLTIAHGVAIHVVKNAEALRKQFVNHEGEKPLWIRRDGFVLGSPNNDWPGCWEEFAQLIKQNTVPKTYERLISDFTTTGPLERAISNLTLMDSMQKFFSYGVMTCCGIPQVTLTGEVADWKKLYNKAAVLAEYDLAWWTKELLPVLEQFKLSAEGKADIDWWKSFYNQYSMSGGDTVTGHILKFFPYVDVTYPKKDKVRRDQWKQGSTAQIPSASLNVPFTWMYHGEELKMSFRGGLIGYEENDVEVRPSYAWAVTHGQD